jgi:hypothetical protein
LNRFSNGIFLSYPYYIFREKNGVTRNDFLDCMMELRKKEKEDRQEGILSAKNPTRDATFGKLTNVCLILRRKRNSAHVITECFERIVGEFGQINAENFDKDF